MITLKINATKLIEIKKALEDHKDEEETIQKKIEVFEKQLERICTKLENNLTAVFEFIEKNNTKTS